MATAKLLRKSLASQTLIVWSLPVDFPFFHFFMAAAFFFMAFFIAGAGAAAFMAFFIAMLGRNER